MVYDALDISRYVIDYSNKTGYGISNLKLQKILYLIQAYFLIQTGCRCFTDKIEAWDIGPVIPTVYGKYEQFGGLDIPECYDPGGSDITDDFIASTDKLLVRSVVHKFADYTATDLVTLTHSQSPWINAYMPSLHNEITPSTLKEYFSS